MTLLKTGRESVDFAFYLYDMKHFVESAGLLGQFAERGNTEAQFRLATLYENGFWDESGSPYIPSAVYYYYRAAAKGHVRAQVCLAALLEEFGLFQEANRWWKNAAVAGHATARCVIGYRYLNGIGVPRDTRLGMRWIKATGMQENILFLANAGKDYWLEKDYSSITRATNISASFDRKGPQGKAILKWTNVCHRSIMLFNTGDMNDGIDDYRKGNYDSAYNKLLPFADIGNPLAQFYLGKLHDACGLDRPYASTAFFYYYCAAANRCREAMIALSIFLERYELFGEEIRWRQMAD